MRKLTILVDLDDTMTDLSTAWVAAINEKFGTTTRPEDITGWNLERFFPGLSRSKVYSVMHDPGFWDSVFPKEGAVEYMKRLMDEGHDVYVVTSTFYKGLEEKMRRVLFRHFPFINWRNVIITSNKQLVRGDVLVDDAPHNHVGGAYVSILMDTPHNRDFAEEGVIRVHNWEEIYGVIKALSVQESNL